jgi:hypothetical protein
VVFRDLYIDWNGRVVPCCNIRSDAPEHAGYIVDDLSTGRSVFEAFAASRLVDWRRSLFDYEPKAAPCDTCAYEEMPDDESSRKLIATLKRAFVT